MFKNDLYKDFKLPRKKPLNLIYNLFGRELGTYSSLLGICSTFRETTHKNELNSFNHFKRIYLSITPNYSILNVKTPNCYLKRFSPDGKYLIAFNSNFDGIQIFLFNGPSAGIDYMNRFVYTTKFSDKTDFENFYSNSFRLDAFDIYFKELCNLKLCDNTETMNRECILFFDNSFLILASSEVISDENLPTYSDLATNNESIHYGLIENYTIYLVDLKHHKLCDKLRFRAEKLNLIHNQSFTLFNDLFLILSIQNQTIHVYKLFKRQHTSQICYKFVLLQTIGRFCFNDDQDLVDNPSSIHHSMHNLINPQNKNRLTRRSNFSQRFSSSNQTKPFNEPFFTGLKQRIVSYSFRQAQETNSLNEFYLSLNNLINLKMHKIQLLDERHLLIKYISLDQMRIKRSNFNETSTTNSSSITLIPQNTSNSFIMQPIQNGSCYVLYDIQTASVLNVIKNVNKLEKLVENLWDYLTLVSTSNDSQLTKFYSNRIQFKKNSELTKFILSQMPMSPQSFTISPYLDQSLFSYDDKLISQFERAKPVGDQLFRFNSQETGRLRFVLYPGKQVVGNDIIFTPSSFYQPINRLVAFIWHPTQPFCISVQRNSQEYNVNFHVYFKST